MNRRKEFLQNCTEAINQTKDGIEKYDCLKCYGDTKLVYDKNTKIHYCEYNNIPKQCMVKYCKTCKNGNNYFCNECSLPNYEVNNITGQCVETTRVIPAITWKDIYKLEFNNKQYIRNYQLFNGPSLRLRGITTSQINQRHAFLIYLIFKLKSKLVRNLEEDGIILPAHCEIKTNLEETQNEVNIVDYECLINNTNEINLTNYELENITEGDHNGHIKNRNINELTKNKKMKDYLQKINKFTLEDIMKYVTFDLDSIQNKTDKNHIFDFNIEGKINKNINIENINLELELYEIQDKVPCSFIVKENLKANLNCKIDINKYKNIKLFSFKTSELNIENINIYLSKLDEIYLINNIYNNDNDKKSYTGIIIGFVIMGVLIISGGIILTIFLLKRKSKPEIKQKDQTDINTSNDLGQKNENHFDNNHLSNKEETAIVKEDKKDNIQIDINGRNLIQTNNTNINDKTDVNIIKSKNENENKDEEIDKSHNINITKENEKNIKVENKNDKKVRIIICDPPNTDTTFVK